VKEINTTKAMWEQKKMLIQHGDMSGEVHGGTAQDDRRE